MERIGKVIIKTQNGLKLEHTLVRHENTEKIAITPMTVISIEEAKKMLEGIGHKIESIEKIREE